MADDKRDATLRDAPDEDATLWPAIGRVVTDPRVDLPGLIA